MSAAARALISPAQKKRRLLPLDEVKIRVAVLGGNPYELMPMRGTRLAGSSDPVVKLRQQIRVIEFLNHELKP